jgi:hypothetical protein
MMSANGGECVGETMQSQIGVPKSYSLAITQTGGNVDATLKSTSGDYACTFTGGHGDASGFGSGPGEGFRYFACEVGGELRGFLCHNGSRRDMLALGQSLDGRISGNQITGTWNVSWVIMLPDEPDVEIAALETTSHYSGSR